MSKIPAHAECVFKGVIHDVYQWKQTMFDGSVATFECLKRPDTVFILPVTPENKVLYAHQEQPGRAPFLSLFGGRAEEGETPLITAQRELLEETGLESDEWVEMKKYTVGGKIDWNITFFVAKNCRKVAEPALDCGEKIDVKETDIDTFLTEIVPHPQFTEYKLQVDVFSDFSQKAVDNIKNNILNSSTS